MQAKAIEIRLTVHSAAGNIAGYFYIEFGLLKENRSKREGKGKGYVEYALLAMVGTQLVVSVFIGFGIGYWLDGLLGTSPLFLLIFILFGVAAGFFNIYKVLKKVK